MTVSSSQNNKEIGSISLKWSRLAKECYNKGCICLNCGMYKYCYDSDFALKQAVLKIIKHIGKPTIEKGDYYGVLNG